MDFTQNNAYIRSPYKNLALALIFSAILGPVGLLYSSFFGGIFMILLGFVVVSSKLFVPIVLLWVICCVWSVGATNRYNRKLLKQNQHKE